MGRPKRTRRVKRAADEDDERMEEADPESEDFFYDEVDQFHNQKDKIMLEVSDEDKSDKGSDDELEEVLGLDVPDSDDEEEEEADENDEDQDLEPSEEEDEGSGLPSDKAWGRKKSMYYNTDYVDENAVSGSDEEDIEEEEEQEAMALQKRLAAALDEEDFDTQDFLKSADGGEEKLEQDEKDEEHVIRDLSQLSREEKLEILIKDSPELLELLDEFKDKLSEVIHKIQPLLQMSRSGKISSEQGAKYLEIKNQLLLSYCVNIGYYLLLKSRQTPVKDHPVIGRLVQFRTLIKKLEPLDKKLQPEIKDLLKQYKQANNSSGQVESHHKHEKTRERSFLLPGEQADKPSKKRSLKDKRPSKTPRKESKLDPGFDPLQYYEAVKAEKAKKKREKEEKSRRMQVPAEEDDEEDVEEGGKRSITYEISKNRGLTARKKKDLRNPRVKHKKKFLKAKIRHKGQVREVVKELSRYGGEDSGIRSHLVHSVKIK